MATLYITEFSDLYVSQGFGGQIAKTPEIANQTVAIGAEAKSAAFNANTHFIRVHADAVCFIEIGAAPTASTSMARFAANQTEYFGVIPGQKLSCTNV